jgi:heat shock protein HtpX
MNKPTRGPGRPADRGRGSGRGGGSSRTPTRDEGADRAPAGAAPTAHAERTGEGRSIRRNRLRARVTAVLVGLVPGVLAGLVLALAGLPVVAAAALVGATVCVSWWTWRTAPARIVRAVGGVPSDEGGHPRLHNLVEGLCASMGLPRPAVFVVDHEVPNAMSVGRDPSTACLVVTSGLDQSLSLVQLEGVLAHELVHVKRADTVLAGVAVVALAPWSLVVGATRASEHVHAVVGRGREYSADRIAADVVRYPPGIGSALEAMAGTRTGVGWPPGRGRTAALTRWLWIDPGPGGASVAAEGDLDDTRVRAEAQSLR